METKVRQLLDLYTLDEVFEVLDITPEEVIEHLLTAGLVVLPPFLEDTDGQEEETEEG